MLAIWTFSEYFSQYVEFQLFHTSRVMLDSLQQTSIQLVWSEGIISLILYERGGCQYSGVMNSYY